MKILLAGEYSNLHNSLKDGLIELGHSVTIVSLGDGFKDYPSDIKLKKAFEKGFKKKFKNLIYKIFGFDLESVNIYFQIKNKITEHYDVVQLINENSFLCTPFYEKLIFNHLKSKASKIFLLSCGTDHLQVKYALQNPDYKSVLTPFHNGVLSKKDIPEVFKYLRKDYESLSQHIYKNINGVIATDYDYTDAIDKNSKYLGIISNPINCHKIKFVNNFPTEAPIIFHGINRSNFHKKGNNIFKEALKKIKEKYNNATIIETENIPYKEYIEKHNACHILLDQCYAKDQGYNALEAMAKGKVVFTGAENSFLKNYNLKEDEVCINTNPNTDEIFKKLSYFIENPEKLNSIHEKSRLFIEKEHHYIKIAEKYTSTWNASKTI